jgi:Ca2+-binding EF-hand superfamily protein
LALVADGFISRAELRGGLKALRLPYSNAAVERFIRACDGDSDGSISRAEFIGFVVVRQQALQRAFARLDHTKDGQVTARDLREAAASLAIVLSKDEIDRLIRVADRDGDGVVTVDDFVDMLLLVGDTHIEGLFEHWLAHEAPSLDVDGGPELPAEVRAGEPAWLLLAAGGIAGVISRTLTAPMDRLRTVLQAAEPPSARATRPFRRPAEEMLRRPPHVEPDADITRAVRALSAEPLDSHPLGQTVRSSAVATADAALVKNIIPPSPEAKPPESLSRVRGIGSAARAIYAEGGYAAFWRGNGTNVIKIAPETALRFFAFDLAKRKLASNPDNVSAMERFAAGAVAGIVSTIFVYPLEIAKTRLALSQTGEFRGILDCLGRLVRKEGLLSMYRGLGASLLGIVPYSGTELMTFTLLRDAYVARFPDEEPGVPTLLTCGAVASLAGQVVAFPLQLVRTRLQAQGLPGRETSKYRGIVHCVQSVLRRDGFSGLYRGMLPGFLKSIPSCMISFATYERTKHVLRTVAAQRRADARM